jgi:CheY-like chemotaxis protein
LIEQQKFHIRSDERVLVVEDLIYRQVIFSNWLGGEATIVSRANAAIAAIQAARFDWIFLDRDLESGGGFGEDVAAYLAEIKFAGRVVVHSASSFAADVVQKILKDAGVAVEGTAFGEFIIFRSPSPIREK